MELCHFRKIDRAGDHYVQQTKSVLERQTVDIFSHMHNLDLEVKQEGAQRLRALKILAEELNSVPSTNGRKQTSTFNTNTKGSPDLCGLLHMSIYLHVHENTFT